MVKNKKLIFLLFFIFALLLSAYFLSNQADAITCENSSSSAICIPSSSSTGLPSPADGIKGVVENILKWMLGIFGVLALIGFVISGVQYITASGSEKVIETAKRNMTYCILGVIVALSGVVIITAIDAALRVDNPLFF